VGMRLTFEADERELESAHKIWAAQVLAAMEYLLHSHNVDHKNDEVDVPSLAELVMTLPPFLLHRLLDFATVRIPAKKIHHFSTPLRPLPSTIWPKINL
jgi:hypothetical protein